MHKAPLNFLLLILTWLLLGVAPALAEDELLQPDQAFRISGKIESADTVLLEWDIADGYYLYRKKFRFRSDSNGMELGSADFPPGKIRHDEFFGESEVYRQQVSIRIPVKRNPGASNVLTLESTVQGCADQGVCYPPHKQTLLLEFPDAPVIAANEPAPQILGALANLGRGLGLGEEDELLTAEQAFQFAATVEGPNRIRAHWQIADETYLYKDKVTVSLENAQGVRLGAIDLPPAKLKQDSIRPDGTIGDVEVYYHEIDLPLPLIRTQTDATEITLVAKYQGCADLGVCYPPQTQKSTLLLPIATAAAAESPPPPAAATIAAPEPRVTEQDQLAATLGKGNIWLILGLFFLAGLGLAFTPCVFPMIPILSGIIVGQGAQVTARRGLLLSLVYVLAMALTYTVAGVLAGLFGENLQTALQNPWILSAFAVVFGLLALSMFGFYDLQLPSSLQSRLSQISNRQQSGKLIGVAIMGFLSALIVGPCVAPPLAGALIYIGQSGDAALGGMALFALSLGMGAPLLAIGASAGKLLPKAGAWMDTVKAVFGVLLLAVAIVILERIIPPEIALLLWGILLIVSAIYMGALNQLPVEAGGWAKLWKGAGMVLLVYGTLMLIGAAGGSKDTVQPLRGWAAGGAEVQHLRFKRIKTVDDLNREVAAASAQGRSVMLDFYADWCVSCKEMERYTFSNAKVQQALTNTTLLQADVTANDDHDQALLQGHFGLPGPPAIIFYGADGEERRNFRLVGFLAADDFAAHVREAIR